MISGNKIHIQYWIINHAMSACEYTLISFLNVNKDILAFSRPPQHMPPPMWETVWDEHWNACHGNNVNTAQITGWKKKNRNILNTPIYCLWTCIRNKISQAFEKRCHEYPLWFVTLFTKCVKMTPYMLICPAHLTITVEVIAKSLLRTFMHHNFDKRNLKSK